MRWTQIRRFFVVVGLITVLYGLVIFGRISAGASVSLWGTNPIATVPAPAAPTPPALVPPTLPIVAQITPAPAPPAPMAPAPASSDETLEQAYKTKLLAEGENP